MENEPTFLFDLFPLLQDAKDVVVELGVAGARTGGLVLVMPVFKRTELGRALLLAMALGFALPIRGGLQTDLAALPLDEPWFLVGLVVKEIAIGGLLGLLFGVPFWAIQTVGELTDHQRSIGESGAIDPTTGDQASVMSGLLGLVAITLFVTEGGLEMMMSTVYATYAVWPLPAFWPGFAPDGLADLVGILGRVLFFGFLVAAPLVVLFLLSDLATLGIGRTTAQIQLSGILPLVKNVLFCVFLLIYLRFMLGFMAEALLDTRAVVPVLERLLIP